MIVQLHRLIVTALLLGLQQLAGRGVVPGAGDHGQAAADAAHLHPLLNSDEAILAPVLTPDGYIDRKYIWNVQSEYQEFFTSQNFSPSSVVP